MKITTAQLQTDYTDLIEALKRGEQVEILDHGQILGVVQPHKKVTISEEQLVAMDAFFGMHKDLGVESVEKELRLIRQGRRLQFNDL